MTESVKSAKVADTAESNSGLLLGWRILVTVLCILASLVASSLYAWAAYSKDLQGLFGWSLADATTVQTAGVFGDSVLVVLVGLVMEVAGPAVTTTNCLALMSGSFYGLYRMAVHRSTSVLMASTLYAFNGVGSVGYFMIATYTITTTWPEHLVGTSIAFVEVSFTLGSAVVARLYPFAESVAQFYYVLAWVALIVGLLMFSIHVKWSLLLKKLRGEEVALAQAEKSPADAEEQLPSPSHRPMRKLHHGSTSIGADTQHDYGAVHDPQSPMQRIHRHASAVSDDVITDRVHKEEFFVIFGITPTLEELRVKYPNISIVGALMKVEFSIVASFIFFCFATSSMIFMQLSKVREQKGATLWEIGDLLFIGNLGRIAGKILAGIGCDIIAHSHVITKPFFLACSAAGILCTFGSMATDKCGASCLVGTLALNGFAVGFGAVTLSAMLKHAFGARKMTMFIGLSYVFFFAGFSFWGAVFVEAYSSEGSLRNVNMWPIVMACSLIPLGLSLWAWRNDVVHASH